MKTLEEVSKEKAMIREQKNNNEPTKNQSWPEQFSIKIRTRSILRSGSNAGFFVSLCDIQNDVTFEYTAKIKFDHGRKVWNVREYVRMTYNVEENF